MLGSKRTAVVMVLGLAVLSGAALGQTIWMAPQGNTNWMDGNNWSAGVPGLDGIAEFRNTGLELMVDLQAQSQVAHQLLFASLGDYVVSNGVLDLRAHSGTSAAPRITQEAVGVNTISARIKATDLGILVTSGVLELSADNAGAEGIVSGTATVTGGGALRIWHADALGGAGIELDNGTLELPAIQEAGSPSDGVVGYWSFDNVQGGTIVNQGTLGGLANGTFEGDAGVALGEGKYGDALELDGVGDYVDVGNDPGINFGTGDWTVAGWVNAAPESNTNSSNDTKGTVFGNGGDDGGGHRYGIIVGEEGNGTVTLVTDDNSTKYTPNNSTSVTDDTWHHLVGVRDGTTLRVYVDGQEVATEEGISASYDLSGTSQHAAQIGCVWNANSGSLYKFFTGMIDEVYLYDRALSVDEIGQVMASSQLGVDLGVDSLHQNVHVVSVGTIDAGKPVQMAGLSLAAAATLNVPGQGLTFTSTTFSGATTFDNDGDVTLGPTENLNGPFTLTKRGTGALIFNDTASGPAFSTAPDSATLVVDAGTVSAVVDLEGQASIGDAAVRLAGGRIKLQAPVSNQGLRQNLLGYWSFDRVLGTTVVNEGGIGVDADGTLANGAVVTVGGGGVVGEALVLTGDPDGDDQNTDLGPHVNLGNPAELDFYEGDFTLAAWINPTTVNNGVSIVSKGGNWDSGTYPGIRWFMNTGEGTGGTAGLSVDNDATKVNTSGATTLAAGTWYHVVAVRDGSDVRIYLDGAVDANNEDALPDGYSLDTSAWNAYIGAIDDARDSSGPEHPNRFFNGLIDEVYVYDRVLSDADIGDLMNATGLPPAEIADFGTTIDVDVDSSIEVVSEAAVGNVTLHDGSELLVTGTRAALHFDSLTVDVGGQATTGIHTDMTVYAGAYNGNQDVFTFEKKGPGTLIFKDLSGATDDLNTTFSIRDGTMVVFGDAGGLALPNAGFEIDGGALVLASADGSDLTLDSAWSIGTGGGAIEAYAFDADAALGANVILVGDAAVPGGTLGLTAGDGYRIRVDGDISGDGGLAVSGTVDANGAIGVYGSVSIDGDLVGADSIDADNFTVNGAANVDGDAIVGLTNVNGDLSVGGELYVYGNLNVSGGDSTVGGLVYVDDVLTITGGSLHGQGMVEVFTSIDANGGALTVDGLLSTSVLNVTGGTVTAAGGIDDMVIEAIAVNAGELNLPNTGLIVPLLTATGGAANVSGDLDAGELRVVGGTLTVGGRLSVDHTGPDDSSNFTLDDGGRLILSDPDALAGMPNFTVANTDAPAWLSLGETGMNVLPVITVAGGALLDGNTTGAVFAGASSYDAGTMPDVNVVLHDGAVWGGSTAPNTDDLGGSGPADPSGDRLGRLIIGGSDGEYIKLGDDPLAIDDIYRTAAFGPWTLDAFMGKMEEGEPNQGLEINVNSATNAAISFATFTTTNTETGVNFDGPGTVTFENMPSPIGWSVITRTGPADGSWINREILVLEAATVYDGKEFRVSNGRVRLGSNESLSAGGTLTLLDGASLILDDSDDSASGNKPSQGTINVGDGAMVWVRHSGKFETAATYTWVEGSMIALRAENFNPADHSWPTNIQFILDNEGNCDGWPDGFPVSDGAVFVGRDGGNVRFDGGLGPLPVAGVAPGDAIGLAAPNISGRRTFWLRDPFDLRFTHTDGNTYAMDLIVGADGNMTTTVGNWNTDRVDGPMTGEIRAQRTMIVGDIHIRSGELEINTDNDEATGDGWSRVLSTGSITAYGEADLRFERVENFNNADVYGDGSTRSIRGSIYARGDEVYVDEDGYFRTALINGTFADEIVVGPTGRIVMRMTRTDEQPKPWGADHTTNNVNVTIIDQPFRIEAGDDTWRHDYHLRTIRNEGSGNNHYYFRNITLDEGAVLSMRAQNTTNFVNLSFDGNATTSERDTRTEQAQDFHIIDATTTGGDRVWTVGETGEDHIDHYVYGKIGDAGGSFTLNMVNGRIRFDPNATYGPNTQVNLMGGGLGFQLPYRLGDANTQPFVRVIDDMPITVVSDGDDATVDGELLWDRWQNADGPDGRVEGIVVFRDLTLQDGARLRPNKDDDALGILDLKLEGDAILDQTDNTSNWDVGDITLLNGPSTLTFTAEDGDRTRRWIGTLDPDLTIVCEGGTRFDFTNQNNDQLKLRGLDLGYGEAFDARGAELYMTNTGGRVTLRHDPGFSLIEMANDDNEALVFEYTRPGGDFGEDMQINLRGGRVQFEVSKTDEGNRVNYLGEVRVIAETHGSLRTDQEGGSGSADIRLANLVMEPNSSFEVIEWDDVPAYINATLEGDATFYYAEDLGDGGGESFRIESATGAHTLTITGGRETGDAGWNTFWVTGPITTAGVVFEPNSAGRESLRTWFQSGSSLDVGSVHFQANAIVEFRDGSSLTAESLILDSNQVDIATSVPIVVGTGVVNVPLDLRGYDLTIGQGEVNAPVQIGGDVKGTKIWTINGPDGVLTVTGAAAATGQAYTLDDATVNILADGDAVLGADVTVVGIAALNVDRETDAGETGKTLTFGSLAVFEDETAPKLVLNAGHDYNVTFTGTSLSSPDRSSATLEVLSENTTVDLGPVTFSAAEETFNIDANHGSLVKLGPLTGNDEALIQFGSGAVTGGGIHLSNSTAWSGKVFIDSGWLRLDAELTGYSFIDVFGGIDIAVNNFDMSGWQAVHLRLSESMVGVTAPAGYRIGGYLLPGQLVLNAPVIDAALVRGDGAGGTQDMLLVWDEYDEYEWEAAVYSDHDGARYEAVLNLAGLVQLGDVNGRGKDFEIAGVIGDDLSAYATTDPNIVADYNEMGSLEKVGSETVTLSGSNTYNGDTLVRDGTLVMGHVRAFGDNANTVELLGGTLRVAAAGASFDPGTVGYNLLVTDSNSVLELAANSVDLGPAVIGDATLVLSSDQAGSTAPTAAITGTLVLNTPEVHEDFVVGLSGTVQSDGNTLVHSVLDKEHTTFAIGVGQKLTIDDDVAAGSLREWSIEGGTVEVLGNVTSPDSLWKTGTGTLVLDGADNSGLTQLEIGDAVTGAGDIVIANQAVSAPADVLINFGSMYTVLPANHNYNEVSPLSEGVVALSAGVDAATTVDFSGSMGLSLGARENVVFAGNLIPGTDGVERHYYLGGGGAEIEIQDTLEDHDGPTSVDFGWDAYNDPIPMGSAVVAANNTVTGDVNIYMPVTYGAGRTPFQLVDPLSGRWITVYEGGVLDLNSTAARQDNIRSEGGSVVNTGGELGALAIQTIWQDGDYVIGSDADGATRYADGGFVRLDANMIKIGTDTAILGTPGVAGASQNAYGSDMDGLGTPGETVVTAGTLVLPEASVLGGSKTLDIYEGATVDLQAGSAWDGVVRLAGTLNVPAGQTLTMTEPNAGVDLAGSFDAPAQFTGGGTIDLGGLTGNIITGGGMVEIADGGTIKARVDAGSAGRPFLLPAGATVEIAWDGNPEKQIGVMYPGATVKIVETANPGTSAVHSNSGEVFDLRGESTPGTPYVIEVGDAGNGFFGMRYSAGAAENLQQIVSPTVPDPVDSNTLLHPIAHIRKTGAGDLYSGRTTLYGDDPTQGAKYDWTIESGDLGLIHNGTDSSALGATAGDWIASGKSPAIANKHLEGMYVATAGSLSWYGDQGQLPDAAWRDANNAHEVGDGFNADEFVFESGAGLFGRVKIGTTRDSFELRQLTLGVEDPDTGTSYPLAPMLKSIGGELPTLRLGGALNLRSGVDATTMNDSGTTTYHAVVESGRVQFTSDLPGPGTFTHDNIQTLTIAGGTAVIDKSHLVVTDTAIGPGGTLEIAPDAAATVTLGGTMFSDGMLHVASGTADLSGTVVGSSAPREDVQILSGGFQGEYWQDANLGDIVKNVDFDALGDPNFTRTDATIDFMNDASFNFAASDPDWVGEDYFTIRWTAELDVGADEAGRFEFWSESDDGTILWIDGEMVIDNDGDHAPQTVSGGVVLAEGLHTLVYAMHETAGGARARLGWSVEGGDVIFDGNAPFLTSGDIRVDANAALKLGGFLNAGSVGVTGSLELGSGGSTTHRLTVNQAGTVDLGSAATVHAAYGTVRGTLLGDGTTASFGSLNVGGAAASIDLGAAGGVSADVLTIDGAFTFNSNNKASVSQRLSVAAGAAAEVSPGASVGTDAVAVDGTLRLTGGDLTFNNATVHEGGTLEFDATKAYTGAIHNVGMVRAATGVTDLGSTIITGTTLTSENPPTAGLLTYYGFEDGPGETTAADPAGGHDGAITGTTWTSSGQIGGALIFDGDDYVIDDDAGNYINGLAEATFAMWVKSVATDVDRGIWECVDSGEQDRWGLRYDSDGGDGDRDVIKIGLMDTNAGSEQYESAANVQTTDWQHLTLTWKDGEGVKLYINGVLDTATEPMSTTTGVLSGAQFFTVGDGGKGFWQGLIDEVRVYDRVLSETEIGILTGRSGALGDITVADGATLKAGGFTDMSRVTVEGRLELGTAASDCEHLLVEGNGLLDIALGSVRVKRGSVADLTDAVRSAYNDGAWDGATGITSSALPAPDRAIGLHADAEGEVLVRVAIPGDTNLDDEVNREDFLALRGAFGGAGYWPDGDSNYDGEVNYLDYIALKQHVGQSYGGGGGGVPEPATLALLAVGAAGVLLRRRREA